MNLDRLRREANKSTHRRYCHSVLIFSGSRFLAAGFNSTGIHAEKRAISRVAQIYRTGNTLRPNNLHLISFMSKRRSGIQGSSFPCENCWAEIRIAGIRKVTYFEGGVACQIVL